jgi:prepilin-type N-terminal cleavage/methylation domain-containing protein
VSRAGVTLVELVVVLLVLGLLGGMSGLAVSSLRPPPEAPREALLRHARAEAIRTGRSVRIAGDAAPAAFLPDGRAIGMGVDPLTGQALVTPSR